MRRHAVVAHFDATRALPMHVRRMLVELLTVCDRVVMVTTSGVDTDGSAWLARHPEITFLQRPNVGYDFKSMQVGYHELGPVGSAEILFCNDSFIGPFVPLDTIFRTMDARDVDFWGMTRSAEIRSHVQSFFMVFRPHVVRHPVFTDFWRDFGTPRNRQEAVEQGELTLSGSLEDAGFRGGAYFEPDDEDVVEANRRFGYLSLPDGPPARLEHQWDRAWRARILTSNRMQFNSTILLADRALQGRLPLLKLEVARLDPAELGGVWLRRELAAEHPPWFEGVEDLVARTTHHYRARHGRRGMPRRVPRIFEAVRYRR